MCIDSNFQATKRLQSYGPGLWFYAITFTGMNQRTLPFWNRTRRRPPPLLGRAPSCVLLRTSAGLQRTQQISHRLHVDIKSSVLSTNHGGDFGCKPSKKILLLKCPMLLELLGIRKSDRRLYSGDLTCGCLSSFRQSLNGHQAAGERIVTRFIASADHHDTVAEVRP